MGWRIFKHTDVGAPSSDFGVRGNLAAVLRACLIDGYGAVLPQGGWSEPFAEAGDIAVFQANTGNRQLYQIDDSAAHNINVAHMSAFESMSDLLTGLGQWYGGYFGKRDSVTNQGWVVVANEVSVIVVFVGRYGWSPQYFGEFVSCWEGTAYNGIVVGNGSGADMERDNTSFCYPVNANTVAGVIAKPAYVQRLPDGSYLGPSVNIISPCSTGAGTGYAPYQVGIETFPTKKACIYSLLIGSKPSTTEAPIGADLYSCEVMYGVIPIIYGMDMAPIDINTDMDATAEWTDPDSGIGYLLLPADRQSTNTTLPKRAPFAIDLTGVS